MPNLPNSSYWVYVLLCQGDKYYTGITKDVAKRFAAHASGRGAKFTRSFPPVRVVYSENCVDKSTALKREHELKKLSHDQKSRLG